MATESLIGLPGNDLVYTDTTSMTNVNTLYPVSNLQTADPQQIARSTGTGSTIYFIHGVASRPIGLSIHNHSLVGATVTFAGQSVTIPARSADGQCTNVWLDLRAVSIPTTTIHQLVVSGATSGFGVGRVCLPTSLTPVRFQVGDGGEVEWETEWPNSTERGYYYGQMTYDRGVRLRSVRGETLRGVDQAILYAVQESGKGQLNPFLFVPDSTVNDAWFAKPSDAALRWKQSTSGRTRMVTEFGIHEVSMGLPL